MSETIIETNNLTKIYNKKTVIDHVNLSIKKGEIISILGPNGAGKTTLINILTTLLKPDNGKALVNRIDVLKNPSVIKSTISVVPQEYVFYDELSAMENLLFFGKMHGYSKNDLKKLGNKILVDLGLEKRTDKSRNFSGGMKRRLNIAIALVMNTDVYFMDEPTAGLDPHSKHVIWKCIEKLKEKGKTVVLTTHDMVEAESLSSRVFIIDEGEIIAKGTPKELREQFGKHIKLEIVFKKKNGLEKFVSEINVNKKIKNFIVEFPTTIDIYVEGELINVIKLLQEKVIDDIGMVEYVTIRETTLEDVFLKLTGRRIEE